ncbi:MAG: nicotinate (nicotinamide) nucleotide adenylyltransferase [Acidobacteria bacterium]|nr:nicotinate (nicotinamide) nucleotide adenylyltransferase [Acidobacteriota bacterium]MDW7983696.1 nicotinate (nicotinamide) nucleotide adenylyltransferase [Acidobacteriota bacterium]
MSDWILFGGRFDPVHRGHLAVADWWYRHRPSFRKFLFVPSGTPPHRDPTALTPAHHRFAMLVLALQDRPWAMVWDDELTRAAPAYTVETLRRFHQTWGTQPDQVVFVMGADAYLTFHTWYEFPRHLDLCTICVFHRPPVSVEQVRAYHATYLPSAPLYVGHPEPWPSPPAVVFIPDLSVDVQAIEVRDACRQGQAFAHWVVPSVAAYIQRYRLYALKPPG